MKQNLSWKPKQKVKLIICPQTARQFMNILHPGVDYISDSDSDELTYADEWLKNLHATKHIVLIIQPTPGRLATFNVNLFIIEPVTALFNTGATCSCLPFPLYNQISDQAQMVEM